jgi:hypothetical protein
MHEVKARLLECGRCGGSKGLDVIDHVQHISRALLCLDTTVVVTKASDKRDDRKNALASR